MSFRIMAKVFDTDLPATEKFVLLAIANFVNDERGYAWPSQETLASKTSFSRQTVSKAIKKLQQKGILISQRRSEKGKSTSNLYRINHVALADTQTNNVAQNDNEVSISDTEVCKGGLHKPLGTLNETLDSVTSAIEWNSSQSALPESNHNANSFSGPPKTPDQFLSLPRSEQEHYALKNPALIRELVGQGLKWNRYQI